MTMSAQVYNSSDEQEANVTFFFFLWWGLLHGPQQGPDRKKEKYLKDWEKENSCLKQKNPPWKTTVWEIGPRSQEHKLRVSLKNRQIKA